MNKFILTLYYDPAKEDPDTFDKPYNEDYSIETEKSLDEFKNYLVHRYEEASNSKFVVLGNNFVEKNSLATEWFTVQSLDEWWNKGLIKI